MAAESFLERIVAAKWREIEAARAARPEAELWRAIAEAPPVRPFAGALQAAGGVALIAEVKRASPSKGLIRQAFDPVAIAHEYEAHGAAAISVLTDEPFFGGSLAHLSAVRRAVSLPVLRKEFILDPYQLLEARLAGADAVLLIVACLREALQRLLEQAHELGMEALVEVHDVEELGIALAAGARLIGINNRNLRTFETRLEVTEELAGRVPREVLLVSESGIRTREDVLRLAAHGVRAILVGESLMRAPQIGPQVDALLGRVAGEATT